MLVQSLAGIAVEVEAYPASHGYLFGYAKLSTGQRFPIYWDDAATATVSANGGSGRFCVDAETLTSSVKNGSITVTVAEYETEELSKVLHRDSMSTPITIDVNGHTVNISMASITYKITITAKDAISGVAAVKYAIKPDNTKQIIVEATDKLGNVSTTESTILDGSGGTGGGGAGGPGGITGSDITGTAYEHAAYYRTTVVNYSRLKSIENAPADFQLLPGEWQVLRAYSTKH